jgi:5-(carboxyamino)imidazole ribonucleotide synthase
MTAILPGSMIGILGGGQLGRMLSLEARRVGYTVCILDPTPRCPASQVADIHLCASLEDPHALRELTTLTQVITYETEHVPRAALQHCETSGVLRPSLQVLAIVQDRLQQKKFLATQRIPQARYAAVDDSASLEAAAHELGSPAILKSRCAGYDGKGQARVDGAYDLPAAWRSIGQVPAVLEAYVPFRAEISVILARDLYGNIRFYPVAENVHRNHVLHTTCAPARVPSTICRRAEAIARMIAEALEYCGVMAVEMFLLHDGTLLVNEIAPRVHNSGHYTLGACITSQFEQHLRAICGLPLGETTLLRPAVMVNLLGDAWQQGAPHWQALLNQPGAQLHLYGKADARPGRKMGHVLFLDKAPDHVLQKVDSLLATLCSPEREQLHYDRSLHYCPRQPALTDGAILRPGGSRRPLGI